MAAAFQPAGDVYRDPSPQPGRSRLGEQAALPRGTESQHLCLQKFSKSGGIVNLGQVNFLRRYAGSCIGLLGDFLPDMIFFQRPFPSGAEGGGRYFNGAGPAFFGEKPFGADNRSRRSIAHRRAHGAGKRIGDRFILKHLFHAHLHTVLGEGV